MDEVLIFDFVAKMILITVVSRYGSPKVGVLRVGSLS